mmetsp:Transcript_24066/g.47174  ORF Transcript_24066/g.47174 Transcript_24066/m.47174 type:complete len:274 (+) Transcript_24066:351-1172(+)
MQYHQSHFLFLPWSGFKLSTRSVDGLGHECTRHHPDHHQGDDPANDGLSKDPPVDSGRSFESSDSHGCSDLAVSGRQRQLQTRPGDDDGCGTQLDARSARGSDFRELDADSPDDVVAVGGKTDDDAEASDGQDPISVGAELGGLRDFALAPDHVAGGEGAHGVGDVVSTVGESVAHRGEHLEVLEHLLRARVEDLGIVVDAPRRVVDFSDLVEVLVHAVAKPLRKRLGGFGLAAAHRVLGGGILAGDRRRARRLVLSALDVPGFDLLDLDRAL